MFVCLLVLSALTYSSATFGKFGGGGSSGGSGKSYGGGNNRTQKTQKAQKALGNKNVIYYLTVSLFHDVNNNELDLNINTWSMHCHE